MKSRLWPHGSPGAAQHRPETRSALLSKMVSDAANLKRSRLVAIRHAIQHRAARLARRARIFHRHVAALAVAGEHAGTDHDRRLVADDDARMRQNEIRPGAVRPDQRFAGENPAPAVVAGHV